MLCSLLIIRSFLYWTEVGGQPSLDQGRIDPRARLFIEQLDLLFVREGAFRDNDHLKMWNLIGTKLPQVPNKDRHSKFRNISCSYFP